jgi:hypothetical protein
MAIPVIIGVDAPYLPTASRPSFNLQVPGGIHLFGIADPTTTVRIEVDGAPDTVIFSSAPVSPLGNWEMYNRGYYYGPFLSAGLHTLAASTFASGTAATPLQTSASVEVNIGTDAADTLQGPVLGTAITGPTYLFSYGGDDRIIAYTVVNDPSGHHAMGTSITIDGGNTKPVNLPGFTNVASTDTVAIPIALSDGVTKLAQGAYDMNFTIVTPDATIKMSAVEKLAFTDATITVQDTVLNDFLYYDSRYRDLAVADVNAQQHYDVSGWREGRDPNAFFFTAGYLASNADVAAAGINPLAHYDVAGWKEGRDPSAAFDTSLYLRFNPDVAASGIDPLTHYLAIGRSEGRKASPVVDSATLTATGFDPTFYKLANPDVARAGVDAQQHYLAIGFQEGRNPDAFFDTLGYLRANPDVAAAGVNPLLHYMTEGWREGRDPSSHFDTSAYLEANPDVAAAGVNPLEHFLQSGITEGRSAYGDLF